MPNTSRLRWPASLAALLTLAYAAPGRAQGAPTADTVITGALASWIALEASPGREQVATDLIMGALPGWRRDAIGNLVLRRGSGRPRRVVACGLDQAGYVVSEITSDGYLRLHGAGNQRQHPLWDQFHEGQRILVHTRSGPVPGVIGVRSTHLWRRRSASEGIPTVDSLWVDIGARSRAEATSLGVALLDPVARDWPRWSYGDLVAGPAAADRAGCAAVAAAARGTPERGETIFVISAQSAFGWTGLSAAVAPLGEVDTLVVASSRFAAADAAAADGDAGVLERELRRPPFQPLPGLRIGATIALTVRSRFPGTLVESVRAADAARYAAAVARAAGIPDGASGAAFPTLPEPSGPAPHGARRDSLAAAASLLATLTETYGVSEHEGAVRETIRAALPAWARSRARTDSAGNLVLALGPDRDTVVFMAHMDEVGFEITRIAPDGSVSLRRRGGFLTSLWEGQTALLHLENGDRRTTLRGVFVPRDSATTKQPDDLRAWFAMDSAALVARGAGVGSAVTSYKTATRLGAVRFSARAIDDRAGCTALILAVRALDPAKLTHKVIFAWSVREETGLSGAAAMANALGAPVRRVYAVDTFVSSESPLESSRFAYAPLGDGVVVRALDNSSSTPPAEIDRVATVARRARIPFQIGTTNGGNDGSVFPRHGAPDIPLSWPGRYSHSPVEVADLRDVAALGRLVAALAMH